VPAADAVPWESAVGRVPNPNRMEREGTAMTHLGLHSTKASEQGDWIAHSATELVEAAGGEPNGPLIIEAGIGWTQGQDGRRESATLYDYVQEIGRLRRELIVATRNNSVLSHARARLHSVLTDIARQPAGDPTAQALAGEAIGVSLVSRASPSHSELARELQLAIEELRDVGLIMEAQAHAQILSGEIVESAEGCCVDDDDVPSPT
jgi:hypothetical protein